MEKLCDNSKLFLLPLLKKQEMIWTNFVLYEQTFYSLMFYRSPGEVVKYECIHFSTKWYKIGCVKDVSIVLSIPSFYYRVTENKSL